MELGDLDRAGALLDSLGARGFGDVPVDWLWLATMVLGGEVAHAAARPRAMADVYPRLLPYAGRGAPIAIGVGYRGATSRSLGLMAHGLGDLDSGRRHLEEAVDLESRPGAPPRPGRSLATYPSPVRVVLNVIWLVLSGLWLALAYVLFGIVMCLLIITIPFGVAAFRLAAFAIWPFGRAVVPQPTAGAGSFIGNIFWFILCGFWMAVAHFVTGVVLCLTIVGIPLGLGNFKLIPIAIAPLGKEIVDIDDPYAFVASRAAYR